MLKSYNYSFDPDTGAYTFQTKKNIEYKVAFFRDFTLETCKDGDIQIGDVYQIIIEKISPEYAGFDPCVSETIINIVSAFFNNVQDALIYICDDTDERGYKRFNTFDRWFNNSRMVDYITKLNNIIEIEGEDQIYKIYTSLMFRNDNANSENIIITYENIGRFLNEK